MNSVPLIIALGAFFYFSVLWLHSWAATAIEAGPKAESRRESIAQMVRHLWPSSTLARLLAIGLPIAAAIAVGVLQSGGGSGITAIRPAGQTGAAPASEPGRVSDRNAARLSDLVGLRDAFAGLAKE